MMTVETFIVWPQSLTNVTVAQMAISPHVRVLRGYVGTMRLQLPSVSAHIFDAEGRLLLVRQRDSDSWSTPGGLIEPAERPADAAVREAWEETGLMVSADRIVGVYGGPEFVVTYPGGDETSYVITAFLCTVAGGALRSHTDETSDARFCSEAEAGVLPLTGWLRSALHEVYAPVPQAAFHVQSWTPDTRSPGR